jgi:O-antigen/teichoic acid export membrane protein
MGVEEFDLIDSPSAEGFTGAPPRGGDRAGAIGGRAFRGAALLAVRQALISLVTVGGVLSLSLLLDPSDFALYGYVTTVMLLAAAVGDLGLGASLIRGTPTPAQIGGSLALQLAFWIPACLIAAIVGAALNVYGFSALTVTLLSAALLLLALQALPTALLERRLAFGSIASVEVLQRVVFVGVAVALAATDPTQWSIPLAGLIAALLGYPAVLALARWRWRPRFVRGEPLFRGFSSDWWQSRIANQLTYAVYPLLGGVIFTGTEVGLMVWALAVTSVPALLAPTVSRTVLPALARLEGVDQIVIFRKLLKALLLLGLPMAAAILVCAEPLTLHLFGEKWSDGIPLLRLESIATMLGLILTPCIPLLFLVHPARRVKHLVVAWTAAVWALTPVLALVASFRAPSIAQVIVAVAMLLAVDRMLVRRRDYSPLRDLLPGLAGVAVAVGAGLPLASQAGDLAGTLVLLAGVASLQLLVTIALRGGVDPRVLLKGLGART